MFRFYNPNTGEHLYTSDTKEREHLVSLGWVNEGEAWLAPTEGDPVFRLYNPNAPAFNHNYTADQAEHDHLVSLGWIDEGVAWYGVAAEQK